MTRNELLRFISERPQLAKMINEATKQNFTRVKTSRLERCLQEFESITRPARSVANQKAPSSEAYKSAVVAFLITLDQKGVLDELLAEIK